MVRTYQLSSPGITAGGATAMKPRLAPIYMVIEDYVLWDAALGRDAVWADRFLISRECDRRDADLMLFQLRLSTRLKPWANYIRWMDLNSDLDWRAQ